MSWSEERPRVASNNPLFPETSFLLPSGPNLKLILWSAAISTHLHQYVSMSALCHELLPPVA
jgi:hypothetical protein